MFSTLPPAMRLTTKIWIGFVVLFISGCQSMSSFKSLHSVNDLSDQIKQVDDIKDLKAIREQAKITRDLIKDDIKVIRKLYAELDQKVNQTWGRNNRTLPDKRKYVKYTNNYQARAIVDFENGIVRVETLDKNAPLASLKDAITATLLTTADPSKTDIFSSSAPNTQGVPFLYPQVIDQDGQLVKYPWRAQRYSEHLVNNALKTSRVDGRNIYAVEFKLVEKHQHLRRQKYSDYVIAAANKYNLSPSLIYGIIETESSFNPYAVSHANAYGLMQVVPATAGKDVYNLVKKKPGQPTKDELFLPASNIDIGSAYLHLLQTRYLVNVSNNVSKEYAVISAYNGGTGNVLKTFDNDRKIAMDKLNQTSSANVYHKLRHQHPKAESRNYLEKVLKAKKKYE